MVRGDSRTEFTIFAQTRKARWSVRDASGRTGRGEATEDRVAEVQAQGPGELRSPLPPVPRSRSLGQRGPRVAGGRVGPGAGHALVGRLDRGAAGALESGAGTRGSRACCRHGRVPNSGDTGFSLGHGASGARVGRPLVTRPQPGVDFTPKAHQRHCSLPGKVACLWGRVTRVECHQGHGRGRPPLGTQ